MIATCWSCHWSISVVLWGPSGALSGPERSLQRTFSLTSFFCSSSLSVKVNRWKDCCWKGCAVCPGTYVPNAGSNAVTWVFCFFGIMHFLCCARCTDRLLNEPAAAPHHQHHTYPPCASDVKVTADSVKVAGSNIQTTVSFHVKNFYFSFLASFFFSFLLLQQKKTNFRRTFVSQRRSRPA